MEYDLILKNSRIIDENGCVKENSSIYIKNGKIEKISNVCEGSSKNIVDCSDYYVTPGFVNLHTHTPMSIFKGIAEDVDIDSWFNKEIFPYESKLEPSDVYWGAMLSIFEMIDNGVTAFADHYFCADKICDAVLKSGIRGDIAPTVFGIADNFEEQLDSASSLIEERNSKSGRLDLRMGPHAPYTCPEDKLKLIVDRAKELKVGLHIHVSETKAQVDESMKSCGKTPFQVLYDAGGFDLPVIIGHGLWICNQDKKYINDKTYFAACPKTYMKLSMGFGNIWNMYKDLNLCTGTDGSASSNSQNPLEQARLFALLGKFEKNDAESFTLKDIWHILMRGHEALNFKSGKIKEGFAADMLIWDLNKSNTMPVYNPLSSIIYSSDSRNIISSIIDGKFVKKDGKVLMDENLIMDKVSKIKTDILKRGKGKSDVNY